MERSSKNSNLSVSCDYDDKEKPVLVIKVYNLSVKEIEALIGMKIDALPALLNNRCESKDLSVASATENEEDVGTNDYSDCRSEASEQVNNPKKTKHKPPQKKTRDLSAYRAILENELKHLSPHRQAVELRSVHGLMATEVTELTGIKKDAQRRALLSFRKGRNLGHSGLQKSYSSAEVNLIVEQVMQDIDEKKEVTYKSVQAIAREVWLKVHKDNPGSGPPNLDDRAIAQMLTSQGLIKRLVLGSIKFFRPDEASFSEIGTSRKRELEIDNTNVHDFESDTENVMIDINSCSSLSSPQRKKTKTNHSVENSTELRSSCMYDDI